MGRNGKYETHVLPRFDDIAKWCEAGLREKDICEELHISQTSFENYKKEHEKLRDLIKDAREKGVRKAKQSLKKLTEGFHEEETEITIREENGHVSKTIKTKKKYFPPDVAAINLYLKNYDPEWHNDDEATLSLKRAKLELEKMKAEAEIW